jgi:hypothetical protein
MPARNASRSDAGGRSIAGRVPEPKIPQRLLKED